MADFLTGVARSRWTRSILAAAVAGACAGGLAGCGGGGGGGNTRPTPPPVVPTTPPTPPTPEPPAPPPTPQPAIDAHLALTHATAAERGGYAGANVRIGVIDSGINRNHPALAGRVAANLVYVSGGSNNLSVDDVVGHGTTVAQLAAGKAVGSWPGGVAPGATLLSARIIADKRPQDDGSGQGNEVTGALGIKPIHQDLVDRGMRIMNNSWGGLYWTRPEATAAIADEYRFFIRDHDGLVVFASGNEGRADPTDMASLPSQPGPNGTLPAADLERGWLAVAALDTANPQQLASYSNACGLARSYCLVAPGTAVFTDPDATPDAIDYYYGSGTSYAAPLVSGAAALVWEKFPYFSADQVRQTVLGTATDLGEAGPDAVFGYGLLDVSRALGGPGRFDWGDFTANVPLSSQWSNAISGDGGLVKRGAGVLTIGVGQRALDYRGDTRVQQGQLWIQGPLANSRLHIAAGAAVTASAHLARTVTNAGSFHPDPVPHGFSPTIGGDYIQQAGGRLDLVLGHGPLGVEGKAVIEGGDVYLRGVREGYVTQTREPLLATTGGLSGRFDGLSHADTLFLEGQLGYDTHNAWVDIIRLDVFRYLSAFDGASASYLMSAQRIEAAFDVLDADPQAGGPGFAGLAGQFQRLVDPGQARASVRSLSGQAHLEALAATLDTADAARRATAQRYAQLGAGQGRIGTGSWSQALGAQARSAQGIAAHSEGMLHGQDWRLANGAVFGAAYGHTRSDARLSGAWANARERQDQVLAYLGQRGVHGYGVAHLGAGRWQRQLDRQIQIGSTLAPVYSHYDGRLVQAGVETGWHWQGAGHSLNPYLGAEHVRLESDGFIEQGAAGFGLQSDAGVAARTQALAGLRAEREWGRWQLGGRVEWQHSLGNRGLDQLEASFVGVQAWSPMAGQAPAASAGWYEFSARTALGPQGQLSLGWEQRFGPRGDARALWLRYATGF